MLASSAVTELGGEVEITLVRSATLVVSLGGRTLLVGPMLGAAGCMPPVENTANPRRNPLVGLPFGEGELTSLLRQIDAVLVTHTHRDHWDAAAVPLIPKATPVLCQPEDEGRIRRDGFAEVLPVDTAIEWKGTGRRRSGGGSRQSPASCCARRASQPCTSPGTRSLRRGRGCSPQTPARRDGRQCRGGALPHGRPDSDDR